MKKYRLQLLSHGEIFNSREDAMRYINNNFKRYALWAEPAIVYYENEDGELRMILTVGATQDPDHKRIYIMDDGELRDIVNNSNNIVNEFADSVATISDDLQSTINAAGLVLDENNINDRVEYRPNVEDTVINQTTSLAAAIEAVSAYAQGLDEKISKDIIYKPSNLDHTVRVSISDPVEDGGERKALVSADVQISDSEFNMLQISDNSLFVPTISGGETATTKTVVDNDLNGGKTIKTEVKLSSDHSIVMKEGGLSAKVDMQLNEASNTLTFTVGDQVKTFALPGFNIIDHIEYDSENDNIVIYYHTGEGSDLATITLSINDVFDYDKIKPEIDELKAAIETANAAIEAANTNISSLDERITNTQIGTGLVDGTYSPNQMANYINDAISLKDADEKLDRAIKEEIDQAREDIEGLINTNLQSLSEGITTNTNNITQLDTRLGVAEGDIDTIENTIESGIVLRQVDPSTPLLYALYINGDEKGRIEIPEDKVLSSVEYDDANHTLIFIWNDDAQTTTRVPIDNLIDTYTAGNGINISDGKVSVALLDTENYLEFSEHGLLKTKGIEDAIGDAINAASLETSEQFEDVYNMLENKAEADSVYTKDEAQVKLRDSDTISINTNNTNETTANVKISNVVNNVISSDSNGLYTQVEYNATTNTLSFNNHDIQLSSGLVKECRYDSNTDSIIITYEADGGLTREVSIPLNGMVDNIIKVDDTNTVNLEITNAGEKTITASVKIASPTQEEEPDTERRENAIREYENGIFVSKYADQYKSYYTVNNTTSIISVQEYLQRLNNAIMHMQTDIADLTSRVTNIESILGEIIGEGSASDFADYGERIARLETMVGDYNDYQGDNDPSNDGWDNNTF